MAKPKKDSSDNKPTGHPRTWTPAQRREAFLSSSSDSDNDYQVLKSDYREDLVPYGFLTFDKVMGLGGIGRRGRVTQIHGAEGSGKCLCADTLINTPEGTLYLYEIFERNDMKASCTSRTTEASFPLLNRYGAVENTSHFTHNNRREVFSVKTRSGNELKNTANHPHLTLNSLGYWIWMETGELKAGDYLVNARTSNVTATPNTTETEDELYFLGTLLADAHFGDNRVAITNDDPVVLAVAASVGEGVFNKAPKQYFKGVSTDYHFNTKVGVTDFYQKFGVESGNAKTKYLGKYIRSLNAEQLRYVLQGYFDCECSINETGIQAVSASHQLLFEIKQVLQSQFGIISLLDPKTVNTYPDTPYWMLSIQGADIDRYIERVGFRSDVRKEQLAAIPVVVRNTNIDTIPNIGGLLESMYRGSEVRNREGWHLINDYLGEEPRAYPSYEKLQEILALGFADSTLLSRLKEISSANYYYDEVVSVSPLGKEPTFDFTLPETHSFIANGVVTHNSTSAYSFARNYQQFAGEPLAIYDFERTGTPEFLSRVGVDMDMCFFQQPSSVEECIKDTIRKMKYQGVRLFVYDSIPRMKSQVDEKEIMNGKAFRANYGKHAQTMGKFYDLLLPYAAEYDCQLFMINQTRDRIEDTREAEASKKYPTFINKPYTLPGGRICRYTPSVMVEMMLMKALKPFTGKDPKADPFLLEPATPVTENLLVVNEVRCRAHKNKVTGNGFREGYIYIRPGFGIDENISIRQQARKYKLIQNHGKQYYCGLSFEDAFITYASKADAIEDLTIKQNPEVLSKLKQMVCDAIDNDTEGQLFAVDAAEAQYLEGQTDVDITVPDDDLTGETFDLDEV